MSHVAEEVKATRSAPPGRQRTTGGTPVLRVLAYGAIFALVLPALLFAWMRRLDALLLLPPAPPEAVGWVVALGGAVLIASGIASLWRSGHGLPMSPFPPERLVTGGAYALVAHPIYVGAGLLCGGAAIGAHSPAGVWIVTPTFAGAMFAFVAGYERDATLRRFGRLPRPRISLHAPRVLRAPWLALCRGAERAANSWREWTIGEVRFINHGFYAAAGAALGVALSAWMAGPSAFWWLLAMTVAAEVGSGAWAQAVEGSNQLLRPYGYFGGVIGIVALAPAASAAGVDPWRLLAAMCVGGCVTQSFGRVRCLVQGCCHGRPVDAPWGIRYLHPRSRVVRLGALAGVPLHPTPLYSILWMLAVLVALAGLWMAAVPLTLIGGLYLVFVGLGRFVEEHYRGEPQTVSLGGLRLYQWLAMAFVLAGAVVTTMPSAPAPAPQPLETWMLSPLAVLGVVTYAAFGVDFPRSNRRFSRLA